MDRSGRRRFINHRGSKLSWQSIFSIALIGSIAMINAKDFFYFDNGQGGNSWRIGLSEINVLNAHQQRSLIENRELALKLVNRDRQLNGLSPLLEDTRLSQAAQLHAQDMLNRNYYAHVTLEGKTPKIGRAHV